MCIFIPKMYVKDIFSIDYDELINKGYKIIIFDLDNTIGNVKEVVCDKKVIDYLNKLNKKIRIVIASNSRSKRVNTFCKELECDNYSFSLKPSLRVLKKIKKKYNLKYSEMVVVGDQLLTDMLMGNRKKVLTILVDKRNEYDLLNTRFNRKIEGIIKKIYNFKEGEYYK